MYLYKLLQKYINMAIKRILFVTMLLMMFSFSQAQRILDFKVKNNSNLADRTMMLDILRAKLYEGYRQEFVFVVNHFKVGNNYAWFMGEATRKDGKSVRLNEMEDCCHVEALFKKIGSKWYIAESGAFSTDVWYQSIQSLQDRNPNAPSAIFY
jgi:hypothetical protein